MSSLLRHLAFSVMIVLPSPAFVPVVVHTVNSVRVNIRLPAMLLFLMTVLKKQPSQFGVVVQLGVLSQ